MKEKLKSLLRNAWNEPRQFFLWLALLSVAGCFAGMIVVRLLPGFTPPSWAQTWAVAAVICLVTALVTGILGFLLSLIPPVRQLLARLLQRRFFVLACLVTLVALFYAVENWRGKRAWEQCKRELEAKGAVFNWNAYFPPAVPDDQNFFKALKMTEWFVRPPWPQSGGSDLTKRLSHPDTDSISRGTNTIATRAAAESYLRWSSQFEPDFDLLREALKRPHARMDGNYESFAEATVPNFVAIRIMSQTLAQRAHCYLLLDQPEQAVHELALIRSLCRTLEAPPTGQPMFLVSAMINVAVTGLYVDGVADGMRLRTWREPQLAALQTQLEQINLPPFVAAAFQYERAGICHAAETIPAWERVEMFSVMAISERNSRGKFWKTLKAYPRRALYASVPQGWVYQNMVLVARLEQNPLDAFAHQPDLILPRKQAQAGPEIELACARPTPFNLLASIAIPNFSKAIQTAARNQTLANAALIACGLERYRLLHGSYPETLDALVPQFLAKLPHDLLGGAPLKYRRTEDPLAQGSSAAGSQFVLYSIGWNEKDDGGQEIFTPDRKPSLDQGDWVWPPPAK